MAVGGKTARKEFDALLRPVLPALYGTALRLTKDEVDAQDLVQQACLKAFRFFHTFAPGTNFKAWIFKVMTNEYINQYHRRNREMAASDSLQQPNHYERILGQGTTRLGRTPEEEAMDAIMSQDIAAALEEIPETFRLAVLLSDVEGFSYQEIADVMGCPVGTVMSRLYRGRRALQSRLYQYAVERGLIEGALDESNDMASAQGAKVTRIDDYRQGRRD